MMDLEVVGRHALLFDDDAASAFVNSTDALVDWNSGLLIDRYDVRHLLSSPPPPRKQRRPLSDDTQIDFERYLDLQQQESDVGAKSDAASGYHSVGFSYGNPVDSNDQKNCGDEMGDPGFQPPFHIPESLLQCLPPTEKVHQIIARTALFVAKNGGQSEIVLRVKQGDNPTFGFLMPDHHLHPYFRYLIDNQDLLKSDSDGKSENEKKETSAALSLLGSIYGTGDEDDVAIEDVSESNENEARRPVHATVSSVGHGYQETKLSAVAKGEPLPKRSSSHKEDTQVLNKIPVMKVSKAGIPKSKKKEGQPGYPSTTASKPLSSTLVDASKDEAAIREPPSDTKRLVEKVVEFIVKNGPQFEGVLTEQDSKNGRFPFLLPSNQFYPYYAHVLRKAQESKSSGRSFLLEKKSSLGKESDSSSLKQAIAEIPSDYDSKEKFKMVLGKSKKDGDDPPQGNAPSPCGISIDAAQSILRAATRGFRSSSLGNIPNLLLNGDNKEPEKKDASILIAANEADSSDGHMTKEQKLKAERLKRAKMFVSMLKSGAGPSKSESPRSLSVEPTEAGVPNKEIEGSSVTLDVETLLRKDESDRKLSDSEILERLSKRKYRSRSSRYEDEEENGENEEKEKNEKRSRKKHRSHRHSRENSIAEEDDNDDDDDDDVDSEILERLSKRKYRSRSSRYEDEEEKGENEEKEKNEKRSRKKHRSHRHSRENSIAEEDDDDDDDVDRVVHKHDKKKRRSRHSSLGNGTDEDEEDMDYRHNKRKYRSNGEKSKELEDVERDRKYRDHKRKHRSHRSSRENDPDEEENDDKEDRDYRHGKRKRRSHRSSRENDSDEEENGGEEDRDYRHGKRRHRSHRSSREDCQEDDEVARKDEKSKKKHKSHHSSRHNRDRHKYKHDSSSEDIESLNLKRSSSDHGHHDLEAGEVSTTISVREASADVSTSYHDTREPSQTLEATEVQDDLRAKIRAMLMANL